MGDFKSWQEEQKETVKNASSQELVRLLGVYEKHLAVKIMLEQACDYELAVVELIKRLVEKLPEITK